MWRVGRIVLVSGLVLGLATGCGGSGGGDKAGGKSGKPVVLSMANAGSNSHELDVFVKDVASLSGGRLRIELRSRWRLGQVGYETALIRDVAAGRFDLGWSGSRAFDSVGVTTLRALAAPLLIDSYALEEKVVRSPLAAQMLHGLRPLGLVGLGILPGPMRKPFGISGPLVKPSDYAGRRIGTQQSLVADATFRALGSRPVRFPVEGEISRFDGIETQISAIEGNRYGTAGTFLTANVSLWPRPLVLFANRKALEDLSEQNQAILRKAATQAISEEAASQIGEERDTAAVLCRAGSVRFVTASPHNLVSLRRAVQPVYDALERDETTRRFIGAINGLRDPATGSGERAPTCVAHGSAASRSAPLDGTYQFVVTPSDLRDTGSPASDIVPGNYGMQTVVIDRGRFAATQESGRECTWNYGALTVKRQTFFMRTVLGGGLQPGDAIRPGELYGYRWSRYRDIVTLAPLAGAISPPPWITKPWHRISATPSRRSFPKRCPPPAAALPA